MLSEDTGKDELRGRERSIDSLASQTTQRGKKKEERAREVKNIKFEFCEGEKDEKGLRKCTGKVKLGGR